MKKRKREKFIQENSQPTPSIAVLMATRHLIEWLTAQSQGKASETGGEKDNKDAKS